MPPPPLPLSEIPSLTLLYKLRHLEPSSERPFRQPTARFNDIISLIQHDITSLEVSAIANAANRSLRGGGGVDGAIHARAGPGLLRECRTLDGCVTGSAKITGAYDLPCEKIIHAVGPVYLVEKQRSPDRPAELLRGCYRTALQLAVQHECKSIAFPCISTGVYGYPSWEATEVVLKFIRQWLQEKEMDDFGGIEHIVFCCFDRKDVAAYEQLIPLYFPPIEDPKLAEMDEENAAALEQALPDPPSTEPVAEGEPETKKQKTGDDDDDWEEIEKPDDYVADQAEKDTSLSENDAKLMNPTAGKAETTPISQVREEKESVKDNKLLKDW